MTKALPIANGILSNLAAAYPLSTGDGASDIKIIADRLEVHPGHLAGVRLDPARMHGLTTVRRRRPHYLLPPRPTLTVSHPAEMSHLSQNVLNRQVTDLYGPDGIGKSALAATLAHTLDLRHFPDGAVFVTGQAPYPDLLQALFDSFYESAPPVKVSPQQTRAYLHNLRVWVILDDVKLTPQQTDPILDALDEASVLIIGPERTALGRGQAVAMNSPSRADAVELFEKSLGRRLDADEIEPVNQICAVLNDVPLAVASLAAHAAQTQRSLSGLLSEIQRHKAWAGPGGDPAIGPALEQIVLFLDEIDRRILTLLAAFSGPSAAIESVRGLARLAPDDFQARIRRLQQLELVSSLAPAPRGIAATTGHKPMPRLALAPAYYHAIRSWLVDDKARLEIVHYYAAQLGRGAQLPGDELFNLLGAIEDAARRSTEPSSRAFGASPQSNTQAESAHERHGLLEALKPMVRAADRNLARLGWWAQWQHLLDLTRRAAQSGGDRGLEAWAMHQLGSLRGASALFADGPLSHRSIPRSSEGEGERALYLLETAYRLRQTLGDAVGATLSQHNLEVLERLLPAPVSVPVDSSAAPTPVMGTESLPETQGEAASDETAVHQPKPAHRRGVRVALFVALLLWGAIALAVRLRPPVIESTTQVTGLALSWEFGDAWNAYDNRTWTQQVLIVVEGAEAAGDLRYYADGQPVGSMFEVTLPLCDGAQGAIRVEAADDQSAEITYEFDSPFCQE
jgi:hypothetical protein